MAEEDRKGGVTSEIQKSTDDRRSDVLGGDDDVGGGTGVTDLWTRSWVSIVNTTDTPRGFFADAVEPVPGRVSSADVGEISINQREQCVRS